MRGLRVYKDVWSPLIGEELSDPKHKEGNEYDKYAVLVHRNYLMNECIVGHMPLRFSKAVRKFLQRPNTAVRCSVNRKSGNRGAIYGLEILITCTPRGPQRAIERVKKVVAQELTHINVMKKSV